jgi:YD repeat-containing protein
VQRLLYRWDTTTHGDSTFIGLGRQMQEDYAADGSHRDSAIDYQYSSTTDDVTKITQYGEVSVGTDNSITDIGADLRTTNVTYAASSSVNASLPSEKTILDNNGATTSDQRLYYDSLSLGQVNVGNNTKQEDWVSGTTYASSTKTFNGYGLIATSTDRNGNAFSHVYDSYNLFVATTTNPLLQKTHAYYNYANGKAKQATDPNSRLTRLLFDGIGRQTVIDQSSTSSSTTYATTTTFTYTDSNTTPSLIHRADYLGPSNTVDTYDYYDGLGRPAQERKQSQTSNIFTVADKLYNGAGELASSSLPYFSSGSSYTSPTTVSNLYNNYFYDPLQRMTQISNAVGNTTNVYYQWKKTTTDPNVNIKDYWSDAFGNLVNVVEHGTSIATTTYTYDALNNLATTTDALGNVRHFTYDGLSRRLAAQDLHATSDTTFGTSTYTCDPQGNITSQTDPKGQVVNRTYDALNRMLTEDYTGQAGTEVKLTYDSCANGIGYLCTASSTGSFASSTYDILGRVATSSVTTNNLSYSVAYSYDRQGNITALNYPDGSQVKVSFNLAGLPSKIQRKVSGGSFSDIISNYDYAPQAQIQNALFGNNASTTYFYDANSIYRLSNLQTTANNTSIKKFAYTYERQHHAANALREQYRECCHAVLLRRSQSTAGSKRCIGELLTLLAKLHL